QLLFTQIRLDSDRMVMPILAESPDGPVLFARQQELGNVLSAGVRMDDLRLYDPWVTIDKRITDDIPVADNLVEVVVETSRGEPVDVDPEIPLVHYLDIRDRLDTRLTRETPRRPVVVY